MLESGHRLCDADHPLVRDTAERLTGAQTTPLGKLRNLFHYVRDDIPFGFPRKWEEWEVVRASTVIELGFGYCNTKSTLMVALCRAAGIPARVHYGLIDFEIMWGIIPSFAFPFLPGAGPHSWTEVQLEGEWRPIDSYINDEAFFTASRKKLSESGRSRGYSVACAEGKCSCEFNFGERGFAQMGAVIADHGAWDDPSEYFASDRYVRMSALQKLLYPALRRIADRNVAKIRSGKT